MNKKTMVNKIIKTIIISILIIPALLVLLFINNLFGSPITSLVATRGINKYINENYNNYDLKVSNSAVYNFKNGMYSSLVESNIEEDIHFYVHWERESREVVSDTFDSDVQSGINTWRRLSREYSKYITALIDEYFDYEVSHVDVIYDAEFEKGIDYFTVGQKFNKNLSVPSKITIYLVGNYNLETIANIVEGLYHLLEINSCDIGEYSVVVENEKTLIQISQIKKQQITSGNLYDLFIEAQANPETSEILFFMKQ